MGNITILLADDHRLARRSLRQLLDWAAGLEVVGEAADGGAALRLARELSPHVVLMAVVMPEPSGFEATRRINAELPAVVVLAVSMHADRRFVEEMLAAGAKGYLLKDDAAEELVTAAQAVAAGGSYLSAQLDGGEAATQGP